MGWFPNYNTDANQYIVDSVSYESEPYAAISTGGNWRRTVYTISERYVGIEKAGAIADAANISAANPSWNVEAKADGNGGGWTIYITRVVYGAWVAV